MERKEKRVYTEDEIKRYMELLQGAQKDPKKIEEVLSFENTGLFQAYLVRIGVSPELVEYAAVVERARRKVKRELERCECTVTDTGIVYKSYGERKICAKNGELYFDKEEYVTLPDEDGKVRIKSPSDTISYVAIINRFGVLEGEYTRGGPGFAGEYTDIERKMDGSIPVSCYEASDGASYMQSEKNADFGNPADCLEQSKTLAENYKLYTALYPRLKQWYEYYFSRHNMEFEEVSDFLVKKQEDIECADLEKQILYYKRMITENDSLVGNLESRLKRMIGFVKNIGKKSPIGKKVANRVLTAVQNEVKPELEPVKEKDEEEKKKEEELSRKKRLELELEEVKVKSSNSYKRYKYLRNVVNTIEIELEKIPLIGRQISKAANRYNPKNDVDFDEGPQGH